MASSPAELLLLQTLPSPSGVTRAWSSTPHPSSRTPLLATASSDKSVHIWDMRDWKLLSTINGGHKRSVRCVSWKDYGNQESADAEQQATVTGKPAMLATGSFDANAGLWVWNKDPGYGEGLTAGTEAETQAAEANEEDAEMDFTNEGKSSNNNTEEDDNDDWHFSTLLTGPDSEIKDLTFSPPYYSANLLATCSRDKSVWVWEEVEDDEWETVAVLAEHAGDVKCVGWCKGGRLRPRSRQSAATNNDNSAEGRIIGLREVLASGSYDDTIRLWRDVEEEGDWMCVGVLEGHDGTVWDLKWEPYVNLSSYPESVSEEDIEVDWEPRITSCSDDLSVRVWKRAISESEREKKRDQIRSQQQNGTSGTTMTTGFASTRLPSVIRPASSLERWTEDAKLPEVHVRSVYAVDWSETTGLVVSCGGDGIIAVYKEVPEDNSMIPPAADGEDTVMTNGVSNRADEQTHISTGDLDVPRRKMTWQVVALIEEAHDEYEINHVCWAPRRDRDKRNEKEEVIISTGDDGEVKVWTLPENLLEKTV